MNRPASSFGPHDSWKEFLAPAPWQAGERFALGQLLELIGRESGFSAAAVYSSSEGALQREAAFGDQTFPKTIGSLDPGEFSTLEIPAGRLLYKPSGSESRPPRARSIPSIN